MKERRFRCIYYIQTDEGTGDKFSQKGKNPRGSKGAMLESKQQKHVFITAPVSYWIFAEFM